MSLTLELTPAQEQRLEAEAARRGMETPAYALALLTDAETEPHIRSDAQGVAWIIGTGTKVVEVVRNYSGGMTAEEIAAEFLHLSPASVHAALRFYYDHQSELDADIAQRRQTERLLREEAGPSPIAARLRAEGRIWEAF